MTRPAIATAPAEFLEAMASAAAAISTLEDTEASMVVVPTVASYSVDPPSVMVSLPKELPLGERFGVSILTRSHLSLATGFWGSVDSLFDYALLAGVPVVEGSLCALACETVVRSLILDRFLVIGDVVEVVIGSGDPLVWWDGSLYPSEPS